MITTAKNKQELINGLKRERDFAVQAVHIGPASTVAKEIAKLGATVVSVIITVSK